MVNMHISLYPGIYIIGGGYLSDKTDCTTLLICDEECALIGSGNGLTLYTLIRNYIELGYSIKQLKYLVLPLPLACIAGACKHLKLLFSHIYIVAPSSIAKALRYGYDIARQKYLYEPCPVNYETNIVRIGKRIISLFIDLNIKSIVLTIARNSSIELSLALVFKEYIKEFNIKNSNITRICLLDEPLCFQTHNL